MEAFRPNESAIPKLGFSTLRSPSGGCQPIVDSVVTAGDHKVCHQGAISLAFDRILTKLRLDCVDIYKAHSPLKSMVVATALRTLIEPRGQRTEGPFDTPRRGA
jgi:diketogulonate reductase-like aldo/keto reductase